MTWSESAASGTSTAVSSISVRRTRSSPSSRRRWLWWPRSPAPTRATWSSSAMRSRAESRAGSRRTRSHPTRSRQCDRRSRRGSSPRRSRPGRRSSRRRRCSTRASSERESVRVGADRGGALRADRRRSAASASSISRAGSSRDPSRTRTARRAEIFARHLAPFADRLLARDEARARPTRCGRCASACGSRASSAGARRSPAVLREVALVAPLDVNVLLTGESGTGKSQIARVIHDNGPRAAQPFVELNCAALPETLLESELFGALPGGHSTATRRMRRQGRRRRGRHALPRRDRRAPARRAGEAAPAPPVEAATTRSAAPRPQQADVRVIAATNTDLRGSGRASAASARTSSTGCRCCRSACRRSPSGARTSPSSATLLLRRARCAAPRPRRASSSRASALRAARGGGVAGQRPPARARRRGRGDPRGRRARASRSSARTSSRERAGDRGATGVLTFQEATRRFQARLLARDARGDAAGTWSRPPRRLDLDALARLQPDPRLRPRTRTQALILTRGLCPLAPSGKARRGVICNRGAQPLVPVGPSPPGPRLPRLAALGRAARDLRVLDTLGRLGRARIRWRSVRAESRVAQESAPRFERPAAW